MPGMNVFLKQVVLQWGVVTVLQHLRLYLVISRKTMTVTVEKIMTTAETMSTHRLAECHLQVV